MKTIKNLLPDTRLSTIVFLFVFLVLMFGLISILLVKLMTDGDYSNLATIRTAQFIESAFIFILPPLFIALLFNARPFHWLGMDRKVSVRQILWIIVLMVVVVPFINLVTSLNQQITLPSALKSVEDAMKLAEQSAAAMTSRLVNVHSVAELMFNLFLISLVPAIGEELFFRGAIQKMFSEKIHPVVAIWITAVIFSFFHFQFYGFIPRVLLGALLGYLYFWSGNLWLPVIAHFLNNAFAVVFYYLQFNGMVTFNVDTVGSGSGYYAGIISGVLVVLIALKIYRSETAGKIKPN